MICPNCKKEYDDSLRFCPDCGAAAAIPVIPEMKVAAARIAPKSSVIKPAAPVKVQPAIPNAPIETAAAVQGGNIFKKITAVLAAAVIALTGAVVVLLNDRNSLKDELAEYEESSSKVVKAAKSGKEDANSRDELLLRDANLRAEQVFIAASDLAANLEQAGFPISYGVICSSSDVGVTTSVVDGFDSRDISDYISANLGDDLSGTKWFVMIDGGAPVAAYAAESADTKFIGSYPSKAESVCLLSFKEGLGTVELEHADLGKNANGLFGEKQ
ncbi:MAG: zinc ribbon domain-containing protein [Ruminococcus sp.]|nr:zinc ribbon domain-containing protein [Ruminococcus sp.]